MADDPDGSDESEPLGDLAERIRARRAGEPAHRDTRTADAGADERFQAEAFDGIASDDLWDELEAETGPLMGVRDGEGPDEHIVPKRAYCEDCEYFSEPPDVHCTHAGTTIVEYVDLDHIRVRNCPVVAKRRALGERDEGPMTQMTFGSQGPE